MYTPALGTFANYQTSQLPVRRTRAKLGKTAISLVISGAAFAGISLTAWSMLQAEFEGGFREFSACPAVDLNGSALRNHDPYPGEK